MSVDGARPAIRNVIPAMASVVELFDGEIGNLRAIGDINVTFICVYSGIALN